MDTDTTPNWTLLLGIRWPPDHPNVLQQFWMVGTNGATEWRNAPEPASKGRFG
jgi:hypothetical protein